jgi:hypothetical protein
VLFLPDGRLGLIDFGCIQTYSPDEWELMRLSDRPLTTGKREDKLAFLREWVGALDAVRDAERIALHLRYLDWSWWPRTNRTPHDFGDRDDLQRGIEILTEILHKHYLRAHPASGMVTRWDFSYRGLLYRLGARIDVARLAEEEVRTTGWRREEYASG